MLNENFQKQIDHQFVTKEIKLTPIKELLYTNIESNHLVCLGDGYQYNWQDLRHYTFQLIQKLETEYQQHQQIAFIFKSGFFMLCGVLAAIHCGKQIILPSLQTVEHLEDIQQHFSLLLTDQDILANQWKNKAGNVFYWQNLLKVELTQQEILQLNIRKKINQDNTKPDLYLFTSGSTGTPKMIDKYFHLFDRQIEIERELFYQDLKGAVMYSTVSHNHLLGLMYRLFFPLVLKMPFWDFSLLMPEQLTKIKLPYVLISSPAFLRFLDEKLNYPQARVVYSSGGKLPSIVGQRVEKLLACKVMEFYGSSETGAISYKYFDQQYWKTLTGIEFRQNDKQCLEILSPLLPNNQWYALEDRINILDNSFELLGRADRIAKIADKRVSLTQIEKLLLQLEQIEEVKVLVVTDHLRDNIAVVAVLAEQFKQCSRKTLLQLMRQHLRNHIELIALPRKVRIEPFMPLNQQGKLNLKYLESLFNENK